LKPSRPQRKQPTPQELRDTLMNFIKTHFYQGHPVDFAKDYKRLLGWVVLKLATYLDSKAVSIPMDRYREIMMDEILMPALRCGDTGNITYLPAYLGRCVEKHLAIHGEDYYNEGKAVRDSIKTYLPEALKIAQAGIQGRDPIRELAEAARLLKSPKRVVKAPKNQQPDLL